MSGLSLIALSASASLYLSFAEPGLAACEAGYASDPNNYEQARCFYDRSAGQRTKALAMVSRLRRQNPRSPYLRITQAHFARSQGLREAIEGYKEAVGFAVDISDDDAECIARANLATAYLALDDAKGVQAQIDRLDELAGRSQNDRARARAVVTLARIQGLSYIALGEQQERLSGYSRVELLNLPYTIQQPLLYARASGYINHGDLDLAARDIVLLAQQAQAHHDLKTYARSLDHLAAIEIKRWKRVRSALTFDSAEQALIQALEAAKEAELPFLTAFGQLRWASLLVGVPARRREALARSNACLELSPKDSPGVKGLCLVVRSQARAHEEPGVAWEDALEGDRVIGDSMTGFRAALAKRNLMQRAWDSQPLELALTFSERALSEIESLRDKQVQEDTRREVFHVWADDYLWLANRLLSSEEMAPIDRARRALAVVERSRARSLVDTRHSSQRFNQASKLKGRFGDLNVSEIQSQLGQRAALVSFQVGPGVGVDGEDYGKTWAVILTRERIDFLPIDVERDQLAHLMDIYHGRAGEQGDAVIESIRQRLFVPVLKRIPSKVKDLVVIPDGPMASMPWFLMMPEHDVSIAPSAYLWAKARRDALPPQPPKGMALLDPTLSTSTSTDRVVRPGAVFRRGTGPGASQLPNSRREGNWIREQLGPEVEVLTGDQASKEALASRWRPDHNFLHIAAHAVVNLGKPRESAIRLAGAGGSIQNGELDFSEIQTLSSDNALVVLAGCSTARGRWVPGDGVMSLARSFQQAGASTVVATIWPIEDSAAADFFEVFYRRLGEGRTVRRALAGAQREMRSRGYRLEHYAGFVVVGDGDLRFVPLLKHGLWRVVRYLSMFILLGLALEFLLPRLRRVFRRLSSC